MFASPLKCRTGCVSQRDLLKGVTTRAYPEAETWLIDLILD